MRKILLVTCTAALMAWVATAPAAAAPTRATNYQTVDMSCDGLGAITIEVVNRGHWGAAKIQGTKTTLLQAWADETVIYDNQVVHQERHTKGAAAIDDVCRLSWSEQLAADDLPPGFPEGTYRFEIETGVKVRGR
jgi:hypothetical protein